MKEEIERRRAEAAEKRQKVEDNVDEEDRPFKCVSPRGSSLKVSPRPDRRSTQVQAWSVEHRSLDYCSTSGETSWIGLRLTRLPAAAAKDKRLSGRRNT